MRGADALYDAGADGRGFAPARPSAMIAPPTTSPQKAPPIPRKLTPEAVVRNVASAASRELTSARAAPIEEPKAPSSARPATASIRIGEPATALVTAPASGPKTT